MYFVHFNLEFFVCVNLNAKVLKTSIDTKGKIYDNTLTVQRMEKDSVSYLNEWNECILKENCRS